MAEAKGTKRCRTEEKEEHKEGLSRPQLFLASAELRERTGKRYCEEAQMLPLLLAYGLVRRVRTIEATIHPLGGDSFKVTLDAAKPLVSEAKKEIAYIHGTLERLQELYKVSERADGEAVREDDAEPELLQHNQIVPDGTAMTLAVKEDPVVWRTCADEGVTLSEGGSVATKTGIAQWTLVTSGMELASGRHYWEVELLGGISLLTGTSFSYIGITRPDLNPRADYGVATCTKGWFMDAFSGGLWGNGKSNADRAGQYQQSDRVGVLLDLDEGSLLFFMNGEQHGPGYAAGSVTGPVMHAMQLYGVQEGGRVLDAAEWPVGHACRRNKGARLI
jgi:hypothetical protein